MEGMFRPYQKVVKQHKISAACDYFTKTCRKKDRKWRMKKGCAFLLPLLL